MIVIFLHPCENTFDYHRVVEGEMCYDSSSPLFGFLDQLINNVLPVVLIALYFAGVTPFGVIFCM